MKPRYYPTVCGLWCDDCEHFETDCPGCSRGGGCVFWTEYVDTEACPVYICCVEERHLPHCGYCDEMPCEKHTRFSNPGATPGERDEELRQQKKELVRRRREAEKEKGSE